MKKINCLIPFLLLAFTTLSFGQANVSEHEMSMTMGIKNALVLEMPDTDSKLMEKLWKKYIKQFGGKTKKVRRSSEWMTDNATMSSVSSDWVDLYSSFDKSGSSAVLNLWVNLGEDEFINSYSHRDQFMELENILLHFSEEVRTTNVEVEIALEDKKLKKLEADLKRLERANENYHKEIENAKERIVKAEQNIITNEKDQESARDLILRQQDAVESVRRKLKQN